MNADYHVHTNYSDDSTVLMEDMIQHGIDIGLDEICFTEHVDYGTKTDLNCDYEKYFEELFILKHTYQNQISIKAGMEFGIQTHTIDKFEEDFKKYPFDFIILSNHQIDDKEFWKFEYQDDKTQEEYNKNYYTEILKVVKQYKNYSVLGHLDVIKRYDKEGEYPDEHVLPIIKEIFEQIIKDGKGIEINTASFRYGLSDLTPSRAILKLYKEMGGTIITLGSDTHKLEHLGAHFNEVRKILKEELGFEKYCTFDKMRPIFYIFY